MSVYTLFKYICSILLAHSFYVTRNETLSKDDDKKTLPSLEIVMHSHCPTWQKTREKLQGNPCVMAVH